MIVVLDTNIIVSAFTNPHGSPAQILELAARDSFTVAISTALTAELERVLTYPRVRRLLMRDMADEDIRQLVEDFLSIAENIPDVLPAQNWLPVDPDDNWVIQCAITAQADRIVTGDQKLLDLKEIEGIHIVSVAAFLDECDGEFGY